ncbi:MAG TPA: siderophore ABC transporter substrate-binding protein [Bacillota bacterium]|nr:siderophore ABC transporter substrate-binding protein [Bacillota bacterium]
MRRQLLFLSLMILLSFTACAPSDQGDTDETETITVEHELGTDHVKKNPEKVVVFDFGALDTLDELGIDIAGLPKATIPSYLAKYNDEKYENVGSLKEPDFEKIAEIDPDVIIISGRQSTLYDQLKELAPVVYVDIDTTKYMESFEENLEILGEIFDKESEIEEKLSTIKDDIEQLVKKAEDESKSALIILANDDKISAYGPKSRFGIIHDAFGLTPVDENIEASTHGMNVTFEYVMERDPDILYVIDRGAAIGEESSAEQIVENSLVERTKAYQNDNIIYLHPDYWYLSGGGLVSVSEMVKEIEASLAEN